MNAVHKATGYIFCECIRKVRDKVRWRNIIQLEVYVAHGHDTPSSGGIIYLLVLLKTLFKTPCAKHLIR